MTDKYNKLSPWVSLVSTFMVGLFGIVLSAANLLRSESWSYDVNEYQLLYETIGLSAVPALDFMVFYVEPGFVVLSMLLSKVTSDVTVLLFLISLTSLYIKLIFIPKIYLSNIGIFSICYALTYFTLLELTQSRAALASALMMLSYHFFVNKKFGRYFISVLVATLFHYAAIIAFLAILFYGRKPRSWLLLHTGIFTFIALAAHSFSSPDFISFLSLMDERKASYLLNQSHGNSDRLRLLFVVIYQIFILLASRPCLVVDNSRRFYLLIYNLYAVSISLYVGMFNYGVVAVRFAEMFRNLEILLLFLALVTAKELRMYILILAIFIAVSINFHKNNRIVQPINEVFIYLGLTKEVF